MEIDENIGRLEEYKSKLLSWQKNNDAQTRSFINQNPVWVRREVLEALRLSADSYVTSITAGLPFKIENRYLSQTAAGG